MSHRINLLAPQPRRAKRAKGWTRERRAHQALIIRNWKPWLHATGPKTAAGKAISALNALVHGACSRRVLEEGARVRAAFRRCREFNGLVRALCSALRRETRMISAARKSPTTSFRGRDKFVSFARAHAPPLRARMRSAAL